MEQKEPVKISLSLFITIIVLLVACVAGIFMFMQNQKLETEIDKLRTEISNSQAEKNELQEKLNSVASIAKTDNEKNNNTVDIQKNSEKISIDGSYKNDEGFELAEYYFSNGRVRFESLVTMEGTYTIEDNVISIKFTKTIDPSNDDKEEKINKKSELKIQDESTLVTSDGTKYIKE